MAQNTEERQTVKKMSPPQRRYNKPVFYDLEGTEMLHVYVLNKRQQLSCILLMSVETTYKKYQHIHDDIHGFPLHQLVVLLIQYPISLDFVSTLLLGSH